MPTKKLKLHLITKIFLSEVGAVLLTLLPLFILQSMGVDRIWKISLIAITLGIIMLVLAVKLLINKFRDNFFFTASFYTAYFSFCLADNITMTPTKDPLNFIFSIIPFSLFIFVSAINAKEENVRVTRLMLSYLIEAIIVFIPCYLVLS